MRLVVDIITNNFLAVFLVQTGVLFLLTIYLLRRKKNSPQVQAYNPLGKEDRILSVGQEIEQFLTEDNPAVIFHPRLHRALYSKTRKSG